MQACECTSKHVDVSIKAWKNTNPSIQACENIDLDIQAQKHACKHVDLSKAWP